MPHNGRATGAFVRSTGPIAIACTATTSNGHSRIHAPQRAATFDSPWRVWQSIFSNRDVAIAARPVVPRDGSGAWPRA